METGNSAKTLGGCATVNLRRFFIKYWSIPSWLFTSILVFKLFFFCIWPKIVSSSFIERKTTASCAAVWLITMSEKNISELKPYGSLCSCSESSDTVIEELNWILSAHPAAEHRVESIHLVNSTGAYWILIHYKERMLWTKHNPSFMYSHLPLSKKKNVLRSV